MITKLKLVFVVALCISALKCTATQEPNKTIEIHAHRFAFSPSEITVKKGETVRLKLISDDVPHSLLIKDLGINQVMTKGKPAQVTFTPQQAGDFQGQCGHFCGAGHGKMTIAVHVTED
jgi:cytochrome c oxidase subunit 2